MKVKELLELLIVEDHDADVCVSTPNNDYDISDISYDGLESGKVVKLNADSIHFKFLEPDEDIKKLIHWRESNTDHWGVDLLYTVAGSLGQNTYSRFIPEDLKSAHEKFRTYSEEKQFSIVRYVLKIKENEGYDY